MFLKNIKKWEGGGGRKARLILLSALCTDFILVFFPTTFLDLHFNLPCFHRTCSIFSSIKYRQHLSLHTFADFPYSLKFRFSAFNISLFETLFSQGNNQA